MHTDSPPTSHLQKLLNRIKRDIDRVLNQNLNLGRKTESTIIMLRAAEDHIEKEYAASTSATIQRLLSAVIDRVCQRINEDGSLHTSAVDMIKSGLGFLQRPALQAIVEEEFEKESKNSVQGEGWESFSSLPMIFESFQAWITKDQGSMFSMSEHPPLIFMVMHVDQPSIEPFEVVDPYYEATGRSHTHSLILSVMDILKGEVQEYARRDPDRRGRSVFGSPQHIVDNAAIQLMQDVLQPDKMNENIMIRLNEIALQKYEGAPVCGSILAVGEPELNDQYQVRFREPVTVDSARKVRKLLEMCDSTKSLIADNDLKIYGIGRIDSEREEPHKESLARIVFTGHYQWKLMVKGKTLMQVSYGRPKLPRPRIERDEIRTKVASALRSSNLDLLTDIIDEAAQQKKGTMLVISGEAERESERLGGAGTRIFPGDISSSISSVTKIDGAVLLGMDGQCYGIGMILDGIIPQHQDGEVISGDPARGARYNSAVRYCELQKKQAPLSELLVVVISEDGMIDWLPEAITGSAER